MSEQIPDRCRLTLAVQHDVVRVADLAEVLEAGDVACVFLYQGSASSSEFFKFATEAVPVIQKAGAAAIICDDTQLAGRLEADGIHLEKEVNSLRDVIARFSPQKSVGCGGIMDRHRALQIGEINPDYVLFGKLGGDIKAEPHPKNVAIGEWWAEFVEIPCMVMAGSAAESIVGIAKTGVDFVLAEKAVFDGPDSPAKAISTINAILDEQAPRLSELSE